MLAVDSIIAIHGRGSSAEKSNTVATLRAFFESRYGFVAPSYNSDMTKEALEKFFDTFVESLDKERTYAVVGCSLGGYWARYVANKLEGARLVMINPSLRYYGGDVVCNDNPDMPIFVYVASDDDVVDPKYILESEYCNGRALAIIYKDGGHRFSHLPNVLPEMESLINIVME